MARSATIVMENNFTRGLVTEFTALNFPENAVTSCKNTIFSELGRATRRLGLNAEPDFVEVPATSVTDIDGAKGLFKWDSVGGGSSTTFIVVQIGNKISFFEEADGLALSAGLKPFSIDMLTYKAPGVTDQQVAENSCQFAVGKGYLFIAHPWCDPLYVEYDRPNDDILVEAIELEVRDFERLDDGLAVDQRPSVLTDFHKYNLYNQGWYASAEASSNNTVRPVLDEWRYYRNYDWPSNSDVWWYYARVISTSSGPSATTYDRFDVSEVDRRSGLYGNVQAPNGHYIYPAFNRNRTAKTGIANLPTKTSGSARPSVIAFYAGRVFYANVSADGFADEIYFSKIIEGTQDFGRCYQNADPTSREIFELTAADGGVISIPTISRVVALKSIGDALVIIGSDSIFVLRGSDNSTFKASDYKVEFVSPAGGLNEANFVIVDSSILWINQDSMYALSKDQTGFSFVVENIGKQSIQTLLDGIPNVNKQYIKAVYNQKDRYVQWLYSNNPNALPWEYDKILEFNVVSKAFYPHEIPQTLGVRIWSGLSVSGKKIDTTIENVTDNALGVVTNNLGQNVTVEEIITTPSTETIKYLTYWPTDPGDPGITFSEFNDENNVDFADFDGDGVSYSSEFVSGYRIRGELLRSFNSTPIAVSIDNFDTGRCTIQGIWDYGFRQSSLQELYIVRPEPSYLIRRIKLRGKGKSLQLKYASVGNAPFSIVGWATFDHGGSQP